MAQKKFFKLLAAVFCYLGKRENFQIMVPNKISLDSCTKIQVSEEVFWMIVYISETLFLGTLESWVEA